MDCSNLPLNIVSLVIYYLLDRHDFQETQHVRLVNRYFNEEFLFAHFILKRGNEIPLRGKYGVDVKDLDAAYDRIFARRYLQGILIKAATDSDSHCTSVKANICAAIAFINRAVDSVPQSGWVETLNAQKTPEICMRSDNAFNDKVTTVMCDALVNFLGAGLAVIKVQEVGKTYTQQNFDVQHKQELLKYDSNAWMFIAAASAGNSRFISESLCKYKEPDGKGIKNELLELTSVAVCVAARAGQRDVVFLLLEAGADANINIKIDKTVIGVNTPLMSAAERGHVNVIKLLLRPEWMLQRQGWYYEKAILMAALSECEYQRRAAVKVLYTAAEELRQPNTRTLIMFAAVYHNDILLTQFALDDGCVDIFTRYGDLWDNWPLIIAIERGSVECLELIVRNRSRWSPASNDLQFSMFTHAFRAVEEKQDIRLFKALVPAYDHWSPQRKLVEAINVDGALEEALKLFGPFDLEEELESTTESNKGVLGPYLLTVAIERCKVRNVEYLLERGVRVEQCSNLAAFRRYYDSLPTFERNADTIAGFLRRYGIPVIDRRRNWDGNQLLR